MHAPHIFRRVSENGHNLLREEKAEQHGHNNGKQHVENGAPKLFQMLQKGHFRMFIACGTLQALSCFE